MATRFRGKYPSPIEIGEALPGILGLVLGLLKKRDVKILKQDPQRPAGMCRG